MKRLIIVFVILISILTCGGCGKMENSNVFMEARILEVNDTLLVSVTKSEYAFGDYILHIGNCEIYNKEGKQITKADLSASDNIMVEYSGQVMLSIPPQVVAHKITII